MVRAPCCEKMGMKKGQWTPEEDKTLTDYVLHHGHGNWRKLPKLAGLLRCGKSCRLRWINYLRPDIKRGNFSKEEEDTIVQMHQIIGNRWSAIAARLPGRTDNEIKNVWHTHIKKRLLGKNNATSRSKKKATERSSSLTMDHIDHDHHQDQTSASPDHRCSSSVSSVITGDENTTKGASTEDKVTDIDESFWSEVLSVENSVQEQELWRLMETGRWQEATISCSDIFEGSDFWYNLLAKAELPELLDLSPETIF